MDFVDIDKVLDDLELNENNEPNALNSSAAIPQVEQQQQQITTEELPKTTNSATTEERNKKFVGVSHVFSSLDDYRRDVESLGEEIKRLKTDEDTMFKVNKECDKKTSSSLSHSDKSDGQIDGVEKVISPADEDHTEDYNDEGDCVTSASSITTSSPSSFSSGPSPGSSTESCSFISGPECGKPEREVDDENPEKKDKNEKDNLKLNTTKTREDSKNDPSADVGLSSISSCLYNENTSSSLPGFSQDMLKTDALSSISSQTGMDKNSDQEDGDGPLNQPAESNLNHILTIPKVNEDSLPAGVQNPSQKVVGFGSTMDEISDTELDSILQEIDSDSQVYSAQANPRQPTETPIGVTAALALSEDIPTEPISPSIEEVTCDPDVIIQSKKLDEEDNLQNADSFSQASTIEFAELRLQSDFGTDVLADDRSTSSNSGIRAEPRGDLLNSPSSCSGSDEPEDLTKDPAQSQENKNNSPAVPETNPEISEAGVASTSQKQVLQRPNSLDLPVQNSVEVSINSTAGQTPHASRIDDSSILSSSSSEDIPQVPGDGAGAVQEVWSEQQTQENSNNGSGNSSKLGKVPPFWIPDSEANACMQCKQKFTLIKRRHHCRACGQVLCSVCCSQKAKLEFLGDAEVRVCVQCHLILSERCSSEIRSTGGQQQSTNSIPGRSPNPNNPMEYCSVIPPHQQVTQTSQSPISVMVPVGVLKREGSSKNGRKDKTVIFSDGIRPGCDLTELDNSWDDNKVPGNSGSSAYRKISKREQTPPVLSNQRSNNRTTKLPACDETDSYIPKELNALPPIYVAAKGDYSYREVQNNEQLIDQLQKDTLKFAVQRNFYVFVKIVKLKCCINKTIINFTTQGMHHVGQDEIIILLELDTSGMLPKDIFIHLNEIYRDADKGHPVTELGFSIPKMPNFLGTKENGGFLFIRPTFQCLQEIYLPEQPFLIGILIHRWEVPWAKIFPLRLMLRLGAQYRYYPSSHISIRGRDAVYGEISQTIINFLADFRNYTYTLSTIKGMYIHMEDRRTSITIPKNRYDQVLKAVNNSSDHILAFGGNFSKKADGHLVCIQNMEADCPETRTYSTQAINIQGQPRKITGASFIVLNGALKTATGLSGKCSIVEDGVMVQILPSKMTSVRNALKNMKDVEIICGPVDADETQTEIVSMKWTGNDLEFNIGVKSPIDSKRMDGIPSIRVHSGLNFSNTNHMIKWTEVFIIQSNEETSHGKDPIDISKLSEQIAKSTSKALVSLLDLLAAKGCTKIGLRATLHQENVCYEAGSQNQKLAPFYMNALDNELIPTLHKQTTSLEIETPIILELIFHILDK